MASPVEEAIRRRGETSRPDASKPKGPGNNSMTPRVEEGLAKALKAQGVTLEEFNKQFKKTRK